MICIYPVSRNRVTKLPPIFETLSHFVLTKLMRIDGNE